MIGGKHEPFTFLKLTGPFWKNKFMTACCAHDTGGQITLGELGICVFNGR